MKTGGGGGGGGIELFIPMVGTTSCKTSLHQCDADEVLLLLDDILKLKRIWKLSIILS